MIILKKKYRLIWDDNKELIGDPYYENINSETIVGEGLNYFETDDINDIKKILENETETI